MAKLKNLIFNLDEVKTKYKGNYNYNNTNNAISNIINENLITEIKFQDKLATNKKGGLNDIFEIYISLTHNKLYLISSNEINYNLDEITFLTINWYFFKMWS